MCDKYQTIQAKEGNRNMAALATPKKSSYIVKKEYASQIINSKSSVTQMNAIQHNAMLFQKNNLKKSK